jgi:translation initiation factor 2B subunit (eIF-2B alpha/beta/delta family)
MDLDLGRDHTGGSSSLADQFLDSLRQWAEVDRSPTAPAMRQALIPFLRDAQAAQPSMALVHQLAARALEIVETAAAREATAVEARQALEQSCEAERKDLEAGRRGVARMAVELLTERGGWIATLSQSANVRDALIEAHRQEKAVQVLIGEGRPLLEGREMAAVLGAAGIPTWLVVDAALPLLAAGASQVWLGADAVTDRGVLNKIGSYALALAARERSIPVYVLAERRKFLPAPTRALKIREMPREEVWEETPAGVQARNVYFELIPAELIRGVVVEDGVLGSTEVAAVARDRPLPAELAGA